MGKKIIKENISKRFKFEEIGTINYNEQKPKISFEFLSGKYCISECEMREKAEAVMIFHKISQKTWADLQQLGRKQGGHENIVTSSLKCRVPERFKTFTNALSFHNPGKLVIVGFREKDIFYVIAVDPKLKSYDH